MTVQNILDRSPVLKGLVDEGQFVVVGAVHDLGTGRVSWLEN
jgi:carbonic anhydrase